MMQFALVPIVVDINHRICQSKGDWVDFICAFGYLITEDWFFAEGERFLFTESILTLLTLIFGLKKKDPMKRNSSGLLVILGKCLFTSCGRQSSS